MANSIQLFLKDHLKILIFVITIAVHIAVILLVSFSTSAAAERDENDVFKVVDVEEFIPPPPPKEEKKIEQKKEEVIEVAKQEAVADEIITTDKEIQETDIDYLPQYKISEVPILPLNEIKSKIVYPPLAKKQGIEGIVYLQLYIDQTGLIKKVDIVTDPGYGFGEAARSALLNMRCTPAKSNGVPVAVLYRYPVRFNLN